MTPFEFADRYHQLEVSDALLGLSVTLNISKYKADWAAEDVQEASTVLDKVAKRFTGHKSVGALPATFQITGSPRADPTEWWCCAGIRRAFGSRGSPDEIADALRLAVLVDQPGKLSPKQYAEKWFGQDCNSFAGNYMGLSPMLPIAAYPTGRQMGNTYGEQDCRSFLPLKPRDDESKPLWGVSQGDALVTFGPPDSRGIPWRHIAVVNNIGGSLSSATLEIAEWGEAGGKPQHHHRGDNLRLIPDLLKWKPDSKDLQDRQAWTQLLGALKAALPNRKLLGYQGKTPDGKKAFRIFLDQGGTAYLASRGWHCGNHAFGH